jgi:hypothetical protein
MAFDVDPVGIAEAVCRSDGVDACRRENVLFQVVGALATSGR